MKLSIYSVRKAGYKVRVIHLREHIKTKDVNPKKRVELLHRKQFENYARDVWPRGGKTIVEVKTPDGREFKEEIQVSRNDSYSRKIGVKIVLGRLFTKNNLEIPN